MRRAGIRPRLVQRALLFGGQGLGLRAFLAVEYALAAVGVHAAADGVEQAPLPHDHREVFAHLGDHRRVGVPHEVVVAFHGLRAAHHFGGHEVLVGVEDHVLEFRRKLPSDPRMKSFHCSMSKPSWNTTALSVGSAPLSASRRRW